MRTVGRTVRLNVTVADDCTAADDEIMASAHALCAARLRGELEFSPQMRVTKQDSRTIAEVLGDTNP